MEEARPQADPSTNSTSADVAARDREFDAQLQVVRRNLRVALLGISFNALVLTYVLWGVEPAWALRGWLGAVLLLSVVRYLHLRTFPDSPPHRAATIRWWRVFQIGTVTSGVVWGAIALLPLSVDMTHLVFIAFLTGGLAAGAVASYAAMPWLAQAFIVPATGAVALGLVLHGGHHTLVMAGMAVVFGILLFTMGRAFHEMVLTGLRLRTRNEGLVTNLTEERDRTARLNQELRQEIGERTQVERSLRESEGRFRALVENALDGIGFTFEGRIYYANQAALDLLGYEAEEVLGLPIESFLERTTLTADELSQRYQDRMAGKEVPTHYETRMVRKDGTIIDVMFSNSLVELDGRRGVMSLVKDITERKKAEEELRAAKDTAEEATRLKDQFVSLLAHDLRAPLHSMFSMIRLLQNDPEHPLSTEQQEVLRLVADQGDATLHMIEDLLSVSRLRTGTLQPQLRFVDASTVSAAAVRQLAGIAREKRIEVVDAVAPRTRAYTDPEMMSKVVYNLLSNAIKFAPRGGRVRVWVPGDGPTSLAVEDNGPGVAESLVEDLFRHEVKTTTPGSAGERGTGLGLPLAQDMMRALGGEIQLRRSSPEGSEFRAMLPQVRPRVLVLGRDESLHLFVRPHLESIDADSIDAYDGNEALRRLESEAVHLVVMEAGMRSNNGADMIGQLRAQSGRRQVPLMLIADATEVNTLDESLRLSADDLVVKPLVPQDFLVRLRRFIM